MLSNICYRLVVLIPGEIKCSYGRLWSIENLKLSSQSRNWVVAITGYVSLVMGSLE